MKTRRMLVAVVMAVAAMSLAACGDDDAGTTTTTAAGTTTVAPSTTTTAGGATTTTTTGGGETTTTTAGATGPIEITVVAKDVAFNTAEITVKAGQEVTLIMDNQDLSSDEGHNIHVRTNTADFFTGIHTAPNTEEITFTIAEPGTYTFFCDTHSTTMLGAFIVTP